MMGRWTRRLGPLMLAVALIASGCPKKAKIGEEEGGLNDQDLGGTRGGSLSSAQAGERPPRSSGPLEDVHFAFDSFELDEQARQILQKNANWLREKRDVRIELEGHCDDRGTVEYNLALGAKRAAAAKTYLVSLGVAADRVTTISYGEELPLCHEQTESCWAENRRAHFVIVSE